MIYNRHSNDKYFWIMINDCISHIINKVKIIDFGFDVLINIENNDSSYYNISNKNNDIARSKHDLLHYFKNNERETIKFMNKYDNNDYLFIDSSSFLLKDIFDLIFNI